MHTLAITGSTGFVGRHFVAECLHRDDIKLRLLTRNRTVLAHLAGNRVTICEGDLLDPETLTTFLQPGCTVVHLAYLHESPDANVDAIRFLIKAATNCIVKRIVHCSTAVVVGSQANGVITEDAVPAPVGGYQQAKYRIEETLRAELSPTVDLAILRPTEIIGPGGQGLQSLIRRLQDGRSCTNLVHRSILKNRRFNYVSIHNVVAALMLLACTSVRQAGEVYQVSDDDDLDNNYTAVESIVNSVLGAHPQRPFDLGLPRSVISLLFRLLPGASPPDRVYSHAKLSSLGYRKVCTLRSAIAEVVSYELKKARF